VDAEFRDKGPAVDALDLEFRFFGGLVLMRAAESAYLKKKSGALADRYAGTASQPGPDWDCRPQSIHTGGGFLGAEREKEVQEGVRRGLVYLPDGVWLIGRNAVDVRLHRFDQIRVKGRDEIVVVFFL
jgi:hypothetical protein